MNHSARWIAVDILNRIEASGAFAERLLDAVLSGTALTAPSDRGLLTELVYGTLRMRGHLDWIIRQLYQGDAASLETTVQNILRTGLYQLCFTDRIPPFAAVNEAVNIAREYTPAASGLVNAVLRNYLRKKDTIPWPDREKDIETAVAVFYSHPRWLVRRLLARLGREETIAICRANNAIAPLTLRVNSLKGSREEAIASLANEGISAQPASFSADGIIVTSSAAGLREMQLYREGFVRIQDEASQLVARLVAPEPGERILDLCAGAGGKTLHLAAIMGNRGQITAVDLHSKRLRMLIDEANRLGAAIVVAHRGDATAPMKVFHEGYDRVLLDAPCSGLGTLRRNPEIRWRISEADIPKYKRTQKHLLGSASGYVRPGGRLIYSVCTNTPEETEMVVRDFLGNRPEFKLIRPPHVPPALIDHRDFFLTSPHLHGMDGFFAAVFTRATR